MAVSFVNSGGWLPAREDGVWCVESERSRGKDVERQTPGAVPQHPKQEQCTIGGGLTVVHSCLWLMPKLIDQFVQDVKISRDVPEGSLSRCGKSLTSSESESEFVHCSRQTGLSQEASVSKSVVFQVLTCPNASFTDLAEIVSRIEPVKSALVDGNCLCCVCLPSLSPLSHSIPAHAADGACVVLITHSHIHTVTHTHTMQRKIILSQAQNSQDCNYFKPLMPPRPSQTGQLPLLWALTPFLSLSLSHRGVSR